MAAKESYKIIISEDFGKHKAGSAITGQTFEQQMDFMMDNFADKAKFKIEPEQKVTTAQAKDIVKKTDTEVYEDAKEKFLDSLTAGEMVSIREGKKKICHNQQVGFYVRLMSSKSEANETHISLHEIRNKEQRLITSSLKAILLGSFEGKISYSNDLFTDEDIVGIIEDIFKGKC